MTQLALPLAWPAEPGGEAFLVGPSNEQAVRMLDAWADWPVRTALLVGAPRSGRSLLARVFATRSGAAVIDDARSVSEPELFHAWNRAQEEGRPLLLVADRRPSAWETRLPDLRSRLAASPVAEIGAPDDALARALLAHSFERRGLDARPDLIDWMAARVERSHAALLDAAEAVARAAAERRRRLSIPFARAALSDYGASDPPDSIEDR
jgi:chromosomal replication initiation ATPase DnaA